MTLKTNKIAGIIIIAIIEWLLISPVSAQNYPFTFSEDISATLDIHIAEEETANNKLLGYNIFNFSSSTEKEFIKLMDPITIRFPDGVWSNFYDWETDNFESYQVTSYDHSPFDVILLAYQQFGVTRGFPGLTELNLEKKSENNGNGYDMLWTFNVNYDSVANNVARLNDHLAKGFEVNAIELGNEHYWSNQRSLRTATPQDYVKEVKPIAQALKAAKPDVKLSIPLAEHNTSNFRNYNSTMVDDKEYFDAISVHVYIGSKPFNPNSGISFSEILTGRLDLEEHVSFPRSFAPEKPVWLSEWGFDGSLEKNAASALGMADCFLYLFEHQDVFERANWFAANEELNGFVNVENIKEVVYPVTKTSYGSVYEIIRSVFENSKLLGATITAPQITTSMGTMNAISARAVTKDGKTIVFAVNLTDQQVPFKVKVDGISAGNQLFAHDAYVFPSLDHIELIPFETSALTNVKTGSGEMVLPPLSVNKIVFENMLSNAYDCLSCPSDFDNNIYPNPSINGIFELRNAAKWKVFTLHGVKVAEGVGTSIDLSSMAAGVYLVNLDGTGNIKVILH